MRKLITAMASAATALFIGATHAEDISGTSFENLSLGSARYDNLIQKGDDGSETDTSYVYWFASTEDVSEEIGVITNEPAAYNNSENRPAAFASANNSKYLSLDTSASIYRTIDNVAGVTSVGNLKATEIGTGIYLDTLIKFTAADSTDSLVLESGDKIAIAYVEESEDGDGDGVAMTNFVIRAGYVNGSQVGATNYVMNAIEDFEKDAWHRLTVRTIANVGNDTAPVGFVVYVDGEALTYSTTDAAGDDAYVASLNSTVKTYLYNDTAHALIPSAVAYGGTGYNTLSAVAFKGNGSVDDISFTTTQPGFIAEGTTVTITWDAGVASYLVKAGETTLVDTAVTGAGSTNLLLEANATVLTVTAVYANGKQAGTWTVSAGTLTGNAWTVEPGAQLDIVSITPNFQVGDNYFETFKDAAKAAAGETEDTRGTVTLLSDYTGTLEVPTSGYIMIDLAGKTITGDKDSPIYVDGSVNLYITNSTENIGHVVAPAEGDAVYLSGGTTTIFAGYYDGGDVYMDGGELTVFGGSFYDKTYVAGESEEFYLTGNVAEGLIVSDPAEGYFTVSAEGGEEPVVTYVASIGDNQYETFAEAFNAAEGGNTIKLLADCTVSGEGTFFGLAQGVSLTIDLNGMTLTEAVNPGASDYGAFYVRKGSTLTITDTTEGKAGKIASNGNIVIGNYGTVVVEAGTIESGDDTSKDVSIYNFYYGADYYGNTTVNGGTVESIWNCGTANLTGGEVTYIDNSGALTVGDNATVDSILAQDGTDAADVENAGVITGPSDLTITAEEGYEVNYDSDTSKYTLVVKSTTPTIGGVEIVVDDSGMITNITSAANGSAVVGTLDTSKFPAYYTVTVTDGTLNIALNEAAIPAVGEAEIGEVTKPAIEFDGSNIKITVTDSETALKYTLQYKAGLGTNPETSQPYKWADVGTSTLDGTGAAMQLTAPASGDAGFYRIKVTD